MPKRKAPHKFAHFVLMAFTPTGATSAYSTRYDGAYAKAVAYFHQVAIKVAPQKMDVILVGYADDGRSYIVRSTAHPI